MAFVKENNKIKLAACVLLDMRPP